MAQRESWATRTGFILAAVGSAVGLGNIWRFPYQVGEQGGAAFLFIYLLLIVGIGFPVILVEFVVGRNTERNPVGALKRIGSGAWTKIGWVFVTAGFVILSYYSVVAGWTIRYVLLGLQGEYTADAAPAQFGEVASGLDAVVLHAIFMAAVVGIVALGIERGIELSVKVMVPAIIVISIGLAAYVFTLDGAADAYAYYLSPEFSTIAANWTTILPAAAAQAFFTLSLGMGVMITYASYLGEDRNLASDAGIIAGLDTFIAFTAGMIAFPILFAAGIEPGASGPALIFVSLAAAFAELPFGGILGAIFFATVAIAALSSAISIMEVVVSYLIDERGFGRVPATVALGVAMFLVGVPAALDLIFVDLYDGFANSILLMLGGLLLSIFVGWVVPDLALDEIGKGIKDVGSLGVAWLWFIRIPVVVALIALVALNAWDYYGFLTGPFSDWLGANL
ncbi:daunorubicin ABC transporter ATP-binding protein [Natrinema sp. CBA1119]|uniref:sodium-dependent transporter n=1 Tax=Natrinema sp. CBA1119 TaxID=1608465 RepID=UPI000BF9EE88|nr:sodium-dependent transporter [Natrinema sp. CBA1119]PGF14702.1 daunorubicin ABC transporter ATP-binding protein [Natrinema sp. CBA1119]